MEDVQHNTYVRKLENARQSLASSPSGLTVLSPSERSETNPTTTLPHAVHSSPVDSAVTGRKLARFLHDVDRIIAAVGTPVGVAIF